MQPGVFAVDAPSFGYLFLLLARLAKLHFYPLSQFDSKHREPLIKFGGTEAKPGYRCPSCHLLVIVGNPSLANRYWDEDSWRATRDEAGERENSAGSHT